MAVSAKFVADFTQFNDAVDRAEVKLRDFSSGIGRVDKDLSKFANQFSGTKVIQDATLMAHAIERIGGVSKLTEAELARVGAAANEAAAKMRALGQDVPASIQHLVDSAKQLEPTLTAGGKAANLLSSAFGQFTAANLASTAILRLTDAIGAFVKTGVALAPVEASFTRLAASVGEGSASMLSSLQAATKGLVSEYDLMLSANKAVLLGLPVTAGSMNELASAAVALGRAMGQDATQSLNDLITALGRSSPLILDNLGLTVKVGEANDAYAAKLGITANQLTEAQKKMAFYEAAMEAARKKTQELGDQTKTLGEIATTIWTSIGNQVAGAVNQLNVGIGSALSSLKGLGAFLDDLRQFGPGVAIQMAALRESVKNAGSASSEAATATSQYTQELDKLSVASTRAAESEKTAAAFRRQTAQSYRELMSEIRNAQGLAQMEEAAAGMERAAKNAEGLWLMERDAFQMAQAAAAAARAEEAANAAAFAKDEADRLAAMDAMNQAVKKAEEAQTASVDRVIGKYREWHGTIQSINVALTSMATMTAKELTAAYEKAGVFVHGGGAPGGVGLYEAAQGRERQGWMGNVVVNSQGSFFQTPESQQRLGREVGTALMASVRR